MLLKSVPRGLVGYTWSEGPCLRLEETEISIEVCRLARGMRGEGDILRVPSERFLLPALVERLNLPGEDPSVSSEFNAPAGMPISKYIKPPVLSAWRHPHEK